MKSLKLLLVLILLGCCHQKSLAQDTLQWSSKTKLQWANFLGRADTNSRYTSTTVAGINYTVRHNSKTFSFAVTAVFYKNKSWAKSGNSDYLLQHEQAHFDLTEIYARKLRLAFRNYIFSNPATLEKDLDRIAEGIRKERNKVNRQYDVETNSSVNTRKQFYWFNKIANELHQLDAYQ
ncbi:MAG: hypothetical protein ABIX01_17015 [Chitinophagaceae bacterium]